MIPPEFSLRHRTAVVTGAGSPSGIGFACARLLGALGAGVLVTSTSDRIHDRVSELRAGGIEAFGAIGDLTEPGTADRVIGAAVEHLGGVEILVNNAGMTSVARPGDAEQGDAVTIDPGHWRAAIARNLETMFLVSRAALPHMIERGWGRIVSIASVTGPVMAMRDDVAYATAKAGMIGLTRAMALDHGRQGITVNAVAPGWIATGSQTADEARHGLATPLGRSATPIEVASAAAWLASPGAAYVTGQCIVVDGGNSIAEERA